MKLSGAKCVRTHRCLDELASLRQLVKLKMKLCGRESRTVSAVIWRCLPQRDVNRGFWESRVFQLTFDGVSHHKLFGDLPNLCRSRQQEEDIGEKETLVVQNANKAAESLNIFYRDSFWKYARNRGDDEYGVSWAWVKSLIASVTYLYKSSKEIVGKTKIG